MDSHTVDARADVYGWARVLLFADGTRRSAGHSGSAPLAIGPAYKPIHTIRSDVPEGSKRFTPT